MNLKDAYDYYSFNSGKASDIARQLDFAGLAIIWIFRTEAGPNQLVPKALIVPAALIVIALSFDLMQYVTGAGAWGIYRRHKERSGISLENEFLAPRTINWVQLVFFWLKLASTILAYVLILRFLAAHVFRP
jgi:hypothetical protein